MKVQVEELSPIERKLSIEVEAKRVTDELDKAYSLLGRQVKIAGFRPGKVPRRILEQRFREQVEDDVIHRVVERAYWEAVRDHNVEAVADPTVTNQGLRPDAPFAFEARVEVKPKLEPKDYNGIPLKKTEVTISDEQVATQLEQLRNSLSRLEPVAGRDVAQAGDFAQIDYQASVDGTDFPGNQAENVTVEVTPGELIESHIAALEGVKVGEVKEVDYAFPADYRVEQVKGKTARFRITLKGLKVKVVPELNDELAKELQGGQTLEELKAKVRGDLERGEKSKAAAEEREALIKALLEKNPFEVPKAMVERALDAMLQGALQALMRSGVDLNQLRMDFGKLREDMRERAVGEVKGTLLFEAIAEKETVSASDEEIDQRIDRIASETGQSLPQLRKRFKEPEERRALALRIREEKTIEYLKSRATYS